MTTRSEDVCQPGDDVLLVKIPMERLGAHDDVDAGVAQRQFERIGLEQTRSHVHATGGLAQHPRRVVDTHDKSIRELNRQTSRELAGSASQINDHARLHVFESGEDRIVNGSVRRVLEARAVVCRRPSIEQSRPRAGHVRV